MNCRKNVFSNRHTKWHMPPLFYDKLESKVKLHTHTQNTKSVDVQWLFLVYKACNYCQYDKETFI